MHEERAPTWVGERIEALAAAGGEAGVARCREIAAKLNALRSSGKPS